jgi:hypothetical protein
MEAVGWCSCHVDLVYQDRYCKESWHRSLLLAQLSSFAPVILSRHFGARPLGELEIFSVL